MSDVKYFLFVFLDIKCGVCVNKYKILFCRKCFTSCIYVFNFFFIVKSLICAFVCLFAAANQGRTAQVCLLLKHKANHHIRNIEGRTALDIAVQKADADVVTLLRLAALNEEIRENDMSGSSDDTFNAVVSEFSQMVYTHPERLRNKSELIGSSKK